MATTANTAPKTPRVPVKQKAAKANQNAAAAQRASYGADTHAEGTVIAWGNRVAVKRSGQPSRWHLAWRPLSRCNVTWEGVMDAMQKDAAPAAIIPKCNA